MTVDQNGQAGELAQPRRLEREERAVQHEKCDAGKARQDRGLQVQRFPEDVADAERLEPEGVDVIGERRAAAQEQSGEHRQEQEAAAPSGRTATWPVDGFGHYQ